MSRSILRCSFAIKRDAQKQCQKRIFSQCSFFQQLLFNARLRAIERKKGKKRIERKKKEQGNMVLPKCYGFIKYALVWVNLVFWVSLFWSSPFGFILSLHIQPMRRVSSMILKLHRNAIYE